MFVLAITSTLLSYLFGQHALNKQREINEKYYLEGDEDAGQKTSFASQFTRVLSYVSVFTYIGCCLLHSPIHCVKSGRDLANR